MPSANTCSKMSAVVRGLSHTVINHCLLISHHRLRPDKTVLSGRRRRCEQSWRQFSVVFNILATHQFCRVWSAVWTRYRN